MEDVCIFYVHLVNFRQSDISYGHLVYCTPFWSIFTRFWYIVSRKIWQPCYVRSVHISIKHNFILLFVAQHAMVRDVYFALLVWVG
jgi:hypothetical protein